MGKFKQLSIEEREQLYLWRNQGVSWREIGRRLRRDHGGLIKEWQRNSWRGGTYLPSHAQERAERKSLEQRRKAPLKSMQIWLYVQEHLRVPYLWTPEQIAGRLRLEYPTLSIHHETIYRYIYSKEARQYKLWQYLPCARRKRRRKGGRTVHSSKIPNAISIDLRPSEVLVRQELGHWETDNVIGKQAEKTALSVTVERVTRFTLLAKVSRTAEGKTQAVTKQLSVFPQRIRKTLTTDNGGENARHQEITAQLNMPVYFCHAYASWEKGSVENINGRIRRLIPKGVSMDTVSDETMLTVQEWLNNTPRKCLGFLTPYETIRQVLNP